MTYTRRNFPLRPPLPLPPPRRHESLINYANDLRTTGVHFLLPCVARTRNPAAEFPFPFVAGPYLLRLVYTRLSSLLLGARVPTPSASFRFSRVAGPTVWPGAAACLLKLSN